MDKEIGMSQRDILDSIKKMVESDNNSSVLELTDLVEEDGRITKLDKNNSNRDSAYQETDVSDFLKLIKENTPGLFTNNRVSGDVKLDLKEAKKMEERSTEQRYDHMVLESTYVKNIVQATVREYLEKNLPAIARRVVEDEVRLLLKKL